ncbi:hypothetical protein FKM82_016875 [Ascaphus truei]
MLPIGAQNKSVKLVYNLEDHMQEQYLVPSFPSRHLPGLPTSKSCGLMRICSVSRPAHVLGVSAGLNT